MNAELRNIKLIIWDLDDTFWTGTLSEAPVSPILANITLVKHLAQRGIMNSICSKNSSSTVQNEFKKPVYQHVFDYFVFPSIDWTAKGPRIQTLIKTMGLRPQNVLFIDDNPSNLKEAQFYLPDLLVAAPAILSILQEQALDLGKDDRSLSRLKQYKLLEQKTKEKQLFSSNEAFLRSSNISIVIDENCLNQENRILELVNRTNQLNYTKLRLDAAQLHTLLTDNTYQTAFISLRDKFGDYGIVGFFALHKPTKQLHHFLFSCRILGMGLDQFLYQFLNFPKLTLKGEISSTLQKTNKVDWIHIETKQAGALPDSPVMQPAILFKGPCDLESVLPYLKYKTIDTEFIHPNTNSPDTIAQQTLTHIVHAHQWSKKKCDAIIRNTPVLSADDFSTQLFTKNYDFVFLSTLLEGIIALYKHKKEGYTIAYGLTNYPFTDRKNWEILKDKQSYFTYKVPFNDTMLTQLANDFEYVGLPTADEVLHNVLYIRQQLPPHTHLVLILGPEIACDHPQIIGYEQASKHYKQTNTLLKEKLAHQENLHFICLSDIVKEQSDFTDCTDHFSRHIYYQLAEKINHILTHGQNDSKFLQQDIHIYQKQLSYLTKQYKKTCYKKLICFWKKKHYINKATKLRAEISEISSLISYLINAQRGK